MKTERRQELRTNELVQSLERARDYIRQHALVLTGVVIVIAAVVGGTFGYKHYRQARLMDAWATLSRIPVLVDDQSPIASFETLAKENLDPGLTAEAWLRVGDAAMARSMKPISPTSGPAGDTAAAEDNTDWTRKAEEAYTRVVEGFASNLTAYGKAVIMLGVLAENRSDFDAARQWYQKIVDDARFASSSFQVQATFRLAGLDRWSEPVAFARPLQTVPAPTAGDAGSSGARITPMSGSPPFVVPGSPTPPAPGNAPEVPQGQASPAQAPPAPGSAAPQGAPSPAQAGPAPQGAGPTPAPSPTPTGGPNEQAPKPGAQDASGANTRGEAESPTEQKPPHAAGNH